MEKLLVIFLPTITMIVLVRWKIPDRFKRFLFSLPLIIVTTILSYAIIGRIVGGVLAGPAMLLCDLILYPAFWLIKKGYEKRSTKNGVHPYQGIPWMQKYGKTNVPTPNSV